MASDNVEYDSSEDYSDLDDQMASLEFDQLTRNKTSKQKIRKARCSVPLRTLVSSPAVIKDRCKSDGQTPKAGIKPFRYNHYPEKPIVFECDRLLLMTEEEDSTSASDPAQKLNGNDPPTNTSTQPMKPISAWKKLKAEQMTSFATFRQEFYQLTHDRIKSVFDGHSSIKIHDIRLASVDKSVQDRFMSTLKTYSFFPHLVYHGTEMNSIPSILQYGFMIPHQQHATNPEVPIIERRHNLRYAQEIYAASTVHGALSFMEQTSTLLACAALPIRRGRLPEMNHWYSETIVLTDESRIIPLFLIDLQFSGQFVSLNHPWFDCKKGASVKKDTQVIETDAVSKKYLRKVLSHLNDDTRRQDRYQTRPH